jgi:hypothetical protein
MFKIDQGQLFIFRLWIQWISSVVGVFCGLRCAPRERWLCVSDIDITERSCRLGCVSGAAPLPPWGYRESTILRALRENHVSKHQCYHRDQGRQRYACVDGEHDYRMTV